MTDDREKFVRLPKDEWPDRFCSSCGCRRPGFTERCPECGEVQFGLSPNHPLHRGWCKRNGQESKLF